MDEFDRIDRFFRPLSAGFAGAWSLGDDAAAIAGGQVIAVDALVEGVHFLPDDPPDTVARKALRVNLSDMAAMGAEPTAYLLALALPATRDRSWLEGFAAGLRSDQERFGIHLVGGDSVSTPGPMTISITMLGAVSASGPLRRSGARPGHRLYVSGTLGDGALGLLVRTGALPALCAAAPESAAWLGGRYREPEPRVALGRTIAGAASAAIDLSDGLASDAGHLCRQSGVGARIRVDRLPLSGAARRAIAVSPDKAPLVVTGGDDYELLFAGPAGLERFAGATVPITEIGECVDGSDVRFVDHRGRETVVSQKGYRHFAAA